MRLSTSIIQSFLQRIKTFIDLGPAYDLINSKFDDWSYDFGRAIGMRCQISSRAHGIVRYTIDGCILEYTSFNGQRIGLMRGIEGKVTRIYLYGNNEVLGQMDFDQEFQELRRHDLVRSL